MTGNGFTKRAQKLTNNTVSGGFIGHSVYTMYIDKTYKFSFKYRSNNAISLSNSIAGINFPINTGDAVYVEGVSNDTSGSNFRIYNSAGLGNWAEISELSITEYDTQGANKLLNSGFGNDVRWHDGWRTNLANYWTVPSGLNVSYSIGTSNMFTENRAQRMTKTVSPGYFAVESSLGNLTVGASYSLLLKYRSNQPLNISPCGSTGIYATAPINLGTPQWYNTTFTCNTASGIRFGSVANASVGDYFDLDTVALFDNNNSQFYYNVFGPEGFNNQKADHIMMFKAGGNLASNPWLKTGATLRWNQDKIITNSDTMPAYTRGTNLGMITVSSIDGWNSVTRYYLQQTANSINSFYGNFPLIEKVTTSLSAAASYYNNLNKMKMDFRNNKHIYSGILVNGTSLPGYFKINTDSLIRRNFNGYFNIYGMTSTSEISGDMSKWTNEWTSTQAFRCQGSSISYRAGITGNLHNFIINNNSDTFYFMYSNLSGGFSTWNKNITFVSFLECMFSSSEVDDQLNVINTYFETTTPIGDLTLDLSGSTMGIPTDGASNIDLLGIVAKHVLAGYTATITVRTS